MAIPENRRSTTTFFSGWREAVRDPHELLVDYEVAGIAINDGTQGMEVQQWQCRVVVETDDLGNVVESRIDVSATSVPWTTLITRTGIRVVEVCMAFDNNMAPFLGFIEESGAAYRWWYDSISASQVLTLLPAGTTSVRCCVDEKRRALQGDTDIIFCYIRGGTLYASYQRERYVNEYSLATGLSSEAELICVQMNNVYRLQWQFRGTSIDGNVFAISSPFLATIVQKLCVRAGIPKGNINVDELYDTNVIGYKCNTDDGVNKRIDALREMFIFDKSETDRKIFFPRRGREALVRIPYVDLVADDPSALKETRIQEIELPKAVTVNHLDPAGSFATNKQTARRRSNLIKASKELKVESEVVLTADQAMTAATVKLKIAWHEQQTYQFATWLKYAQVVSTDVVEVEDKDGNWHRVRITERNDDHPLIKFEAVADAGQDVYSTLGVGHSLPPPVSTTPGLVGETLLEILNIPTLRDQDDELGVYIAVCGQTSAWYGAQILVSTDNGANFFEAMQIETPATIGETLTDLEEEISAQYPSNQSVEVLVNFPLESLTRANLLKNGNRCVIGDELLQFQFAVLLGMVGNKYHYRLSGLVRGRKATDVEFWPTGTRFVVLDSSIAFMQAQQWMLGKEIQIKPVSLGLTEDETIATAYDYLEGVSQREFPVHHVTATRDVSNNVTVNFIGRGRLGIETSPRNGKYFAGYRIKFSNGHTIDTPNMTGTYNSAPGGLTVQVCALNTVTGEGPYSPAVST